ncbi:MAG: hypothetical protein AM324_003405 [Candidatus Thorarchaeota archaeon SMTZ1-83]|nr:MAG: hypothetical protein AM324_04430 [Candidatus Thorarchaeota archaeon SMTZ1-83]
MMRRTIRIALLLLICIMSMGSTVAYDSPNMTDSVSVENLYFEAQEQYNISSYYDFAVATGNLMIDNLLDTTDGAVYFYGNHDWSYVEKNLQSLIDYYWTIAGLTRLYQISVELGNPNTTLSIWISRVAERMVDLFQDPDYPGFYVNAFSVPLLAQTKRSGIQAYAYQALVTAESVNSSIDFTDAKQSALKSITDMLYDYTNGGLHFFTLRNGSLDIPETINEVYPNDGKRLDHLVLATTMLYDEGEASANSTLIWMADRSLSFMIEHMPVYNGTDYLGLRLATNRTGGDPPGIPSNERPARTVVSDLNAMAIRALVRGHEVTGNSTYLDWAMETLDALLKYSWDDEHGGWFTEMVDGLPYEPPPEEGVRFYKLSEIQFQIVFTLEALYEATIHSFYIQLAIDTLDIVLAKLWDPVDGGFVWNGDQKADVLTEDWELHYTAVQSQAILALERIWAYGLPIISYVRVSPTNPRPFDEISLGATALDSDGIDTVLVNYTVSQNDTDLSSLVRLMPNPEVGGVFNASLGTLPDGSRVNFVVIANDTLGNVFIAGSYYFVVREDIWGPVVVLREIYPTGGIRVGDDVIIEIGTYEFPIHSHIVSCQIHWKVNDGAYEPVNLTLVDVDGEYLVWRILLGQFYSGDVISFYCLVEDESSNLGESALYRLTILGPFETVTPIAAWQVLAGVGLVAAPGLGYAYARFRRGGAMEAQREGKRDARRRARRRRPRRDRTRANR